MQIAANLKEKKRVSMGGRIRRKETRHHMPENRRKTREYVARGNPDRKVARPSKNYGKHDDIKIGKSKTNKC